jgi:hypothetical protein
MTAQVDKHPVSGITPVGKAYTLHPTWKRKIHAIMYDNPAVMCPYCGEVNVYLENPCEKCGHEMLEVKEVLVDG